MPLLTVTMPAFNAQVTIGKAIRSTLRAMPRDSELVVLDDLSADATVKEIARIHDSRLRVIVGQENVGGGRARNRLIHETDSRFVASMDADDVSAPWRFRRQLAALENFDAVFGGAVRFGATPARVPRPSRPSFLNPAEFKAALLFHNPAFHPTFAARREALPSVPYRDMRTAQDYDLWMRMASSGSTMVRLPEPLIGYRVSASQISSGDGYRERVKSDPNLGASYRALASSIGIVSVETPGEAAVEMLERSLPLVLSAFRASNRRYYRSLLLSDQILIPE